MTHSKIEADGLAVCKKDLIEGQHGFLVKVRMDIHMANPEANPCPDGRLIQGTVQSTDNIMFFRRKA